VVDTARGHDSVPAAREAHTVSHPEQKTGAARGQPSARPPSRPGLIALVGNTPLVPIRRVNPNPRVQILAKLERNNPGGSVKDRIALAMIEAGERSGELGPGKTILEATSGNTGIGLAMIAAAKGYPILLAMSEGVSVERRKILAAYGAEFLLTPASEGTDGAIERAYELAASEPDKYFLTDQYNNPANVLAHYHTTALELWEQTEGKLTHFVATMGTTGTVMGCSRRFRELNPAIRIIGVEPYLGHKIQGLKNLKEAYVPGIYDQSALSEKVNIDDDAAYEMARRLAREEGLLVGMSAGAAAHVACELARQIPSGLIVALLPDGGERYLSTTLFQVATADAVVSKLNFFNTLTRRYQAFEPINPGQPVGLYSCGPTVHRRPHLGLLRRMLAADLVRRTLEYSGFSVKHVVSITDLDDNTLQEAERTGESMAELCARHEAEFHADMQALAILPAHTFARASQSVQEMIDFTGDLVSRGYAYEKLHSVYFNISRVERYGELSGKDLGKIKVGATVDLERYEKDDPRDFTLLRRSHLGEIRKGISYKTQWGNVRPSWHVQCSAMARAHLGERFDIHTASVDLIFPHNENEIAQSRALTGRTQAEFWLHSELVLVAGKKMTYAEDTCITLPDLLARGFTAREVRFFLLQQHYRQPVHLSDERLEASRSALRRIDACVDNLRRVHSPVPCVNEIDSWLLEMKESFRQALLDDINTPTALAAVSRLIRQANYLMAERRLCPKHAALMLEALQDADRMLAVLLPDSEHAAPSARVQQLLAEREQARDRGDFQRADELRREIELLGFAVEDHPQGPRLKRR
jgi:cysteinyl-tRNA synthetase